METVEAIVYLLCFLTSFVALALLLRSYARNRSPLLLWTGIAFVALALNNLLLFVDLVLLPDVDLLALRQVASLIAAALFVYGFVWEVD